VPLRYQLLRDPPLLGEKEGELVVVVVVVVVVELAVSFETVKG
jgi:hypothetical protein